MEMTVGEPTYVMNDTKEIPAFLLASVAYDLAATGSRRR